MSDLATRRLPRRKGGCVSEPHAANPSVSGGEAGGGRDTSPLIPLRDNAGICPGLEGLSRLGCVLAASARGQEEARAAAGACEQPQQGASARSRKAPAVLHLGHVFILFLISLFLYKRDPSVAPRLLYSLSSSTRTRWHRILVGHGNGSKKNPLRVSPKLFTNTEAHVLEARRTPAAWEPLTSS